MEELRADVVMKVPAGVRAADDHDDELAAHEHLLVAHGWLQRVAILVYPVPEIEWRCQFGWHGVVLRSVVCR
jgi:hypothetical protein